LTGLKHLNRLDQVLASNELSGENEGILLDSAGDVADGISNNVFVVKGKSIFTPPLQNCGVWGVMRTYLLSKATGYSPYTLSEKRISTNDLFNADEILLTNALRGVRNLYAIGDRWQAGATSAGDRLRAMLLDQVHPEFVSY